MARILVSDGDSRTALATTRSLIRDGHDVFVAAHGAKSLAGVSHGAHPVVIRASALNEPTAYARETAAFTVRAGIDLLLPVSDAAVEALLGHRELLPERVLLPFPSLPQFRLGTDKARVLALAHAAGFVVPTSVVLRSVLELDRVDEVVLPAFVKPHRSVVTDTNGRAYKLDVSCVTTRDALRACLLALPPAAFPVLLQEAIHGHGEGCFALRWQGATVAEFAHRRLREKPPAGGISVFREAIPLCPTLGASTRALLDALDWQGVAMAECKVEHETGRHVFMELNGRLWGSLQLAIDAGVDFPTILVNCALSTSTGASTGALAGAAPVVVTSPPYRTGVRSRWSWGDADHLYARLRKSPETLQLVPPFPGRLTVLREFLVAPFARTTREEIGRWSDPLPLLLESARRLAAPLTGLSALLRAQLASPASAPGGPADLQHPLPGAVPAHQRTASPASLD